jgi:hypothetical protein
MQARRLSRVITVALVGTALLSTCAEEAPPMAIGPSESSTTQEETTTTTDRETATTDEETTTTTARETTTTTEQETTTTTEPGGTAGTTEFHAEDLVGQPVDGEALTALLDAYTWEIDGGHYKFLYDGIELSVDQGLGISAVFLYAQGRSDYDEYLGTLPFDMYWGAPWSAIHARFGEPTQLFEPSEYDDEPTLSVQYEILDMPYTTLDLYFSPGDGTPESMGLVQATFSTT